MSLHTNFFMMIWSKLKHYFRPSFVLLIYSFSLGDAEEMLLMTGLVHKNAESAVLSIHRLIQAAILRNQSPDIQKKKTFDITVRILSWGFS